MTVRANMRLESVVIMHGWAINHRTTSHDLPFSPAPSHDHLRAMPPCLPHQELDINNPEDSPLAPGGKTSRQLKKEVQEI
jgi:hypothetical protein